jgi:hypothetical protein
LVLGNLGLHYKPAGKQDEADAEELPEWGKLNDAGMISGNDPASHAGKMIFEKLPAVFAVSGHDKEVADEKRGDQGVPRGVKTAVSIGVVRPRARQNP